MMTGMMFLSLLLLLILQHSACFLAVPSTSTRNVEITTLHMGRRSFAARPAVVANATIDFRNFWLRSIGNFTVCEPPERYPDHESWSGSLYWDEGDHVVRLSDHWTGQFGVGPIKECRWYLVDSERTLPNVNVVARCSYEDLLMIRKKTMKKRKKWKKRKK
jgi:hypothetical protein